MNACHTQEQEKYRSSMFYVRIFQLFFTFVSYRYDLVAKKETFLIMVITSFTLWEKWCSHTVQPKYEDVSTIFVDFMNILTSFGRTMNFCAISTPQGAGSTTPYCWPCIVTTWILATPFYVPHLTLILEMKYNISTWIVFHSVDNESESFWSNLNAFIC